MSINLGNKKFKKLYKGDKTLVRMYKGDEKIFEDLEALYGYKFTINTKLTSSGTESTGQAAQINIGKNFGSQTVRVYWGDGSYSDVQKNATIFHSYYQTGHGTYQILVMPTQYSNGEPIAGWLNGFASGGQDNEAAKIISIDKPFPVNSYNVVVGENNFKNAFARLCNITSVPDNWLDNINVSMGNITAASFRELFYYTFYNFGRWTHPAVDIITLGKNLIDQVDFSLATDLDSTFYGMYYLAYEDSTTGTIPAGFFDIDTSNCTVFASTFRMSMYGQGSAFSTLPSGLFDIDTSSGTNFFYAFASLSGATTVPADLFSGIVTSNGTNFSYMFAGTFSTLSYIPAGIFDFLDTSSGTDFSYMFTNTFSIRDNISIPEDLFDSIDTSNGTSFAGMFFSTFSTGNQKRVTIPAGLFSFLDTSNGINFSSMFARTFMESANNIPQGLFSSLNTSNGVNFSNMFENTFRYGLRGQTTAFSIPADLFDFDTSNGDNFSNMFVNTFYNLGNQRKITVPSTLFDLDTSNGTNLSNMFLGTFSWSWVDWTTLPTGLFHLDLTKADNVSGMFSGTFSSSGQNVTSTIPKVFDMDTSHCTNFNSMFSNTFSNLSYALFQYEVGITPGIFDFLDTSNATDMENMFSGTFASTFITPPTGMFKNISFASVPSDKYGNIFRQTFGLNNGMQGGSNIRIPINDVFDGMSDFTWATAANASSVFQLMYANTNTSNRPKYTGNASTILQHFNFDPTADTNMFRYQDLLADYATINDNWK